MKTHQLLCLVTVAILSGCSSSATKPSSTTIDPQIAVLQKQVEDLQTKVNATTIPTTTTTTTTTPKAAVKIVEISRFFSGYTKGQGSSSQHQCREIIKYSDGTEFESPRRWVQTEQNSFGNYNVRNC